ncbi:SepM family pheromone-processing serine protease [Alkalihalobacillus sp. AL-G]|uniref:SepM family pheromone-processing serine protease n=1 Tax=Alkalihalobacillus sp. AL-G TaxID=2926399 RepID=UPI00272A5A00|nr:SepM family pheromone-processing serine protease [Alkalihalobacillus sp. AL-G]WLD95045.1 PDZ domain-containing protein [Alkalihalobacillus sp. AL-G]
MEKNRVFNFRAQWPWVILLLIILAALLPLPYYMTQPGSAKVLEPIVDVENGDESKGVFMLTTVLVGKANVAEYIWAKASEYRDVFPKEQIRGTDETDEEYEARQLQLMQSSQDAARIVAFKAAGKEIEILHKGVLVTGVISGMPAAKKLVVGDLIIALNGEPIYTAEQLIQGLKKFSENDKVTLTVKNSDQKKEVELTLKPFPEKLVKNGDQNKFGIGITYPVTFTEVETDPTVKIDTNQIGGPSAGFMFTLEIYDQLTKEDWTKGYRIAGTGTMNIEGKIGPIGGIKQKVVAADNANADIFFAPVAASNYKHAKEAAKDINTEMKIVPVETFQDAIDFLKGLESKH